jgi:NTP pyrophosphatase (non-canonical NTP hydrolase)
MEVSKEELAERLWRISALIKHSNEMGEQLEAEFDRLSARMKQHKRALRASLKERDRIRTKLNMD